MGQRRRAVLTLLAALVAAACSGRDSGHLRIALGSAPVSLDPHRTNEASAFSVNSNIYDTLVRTDASLGLRPGLARRWFNPDDTTWTLELVRGVRFHDGSPLTAADVAASLLRARDDPRSEWRSGLEPVEDVLAPTTNQVIVRTRKPYPLLLRYLAGIAIVPQAATRRAEDLDENPIGSGPYRFVSQDRAAGTVELRRWDGYFESPPPAERVTFSAIEDEGERISALVSGAADIITDVPPSAVAGLKGAPGVRVLRTAGMREMFLAFDVASARTPYVSTERNPFRDVRVRRAFLQAIDTAALVRDVLQGLGQPATQFAAPGVFGSDPGLLPLPFDTDAARAQLADAGFPAGFTVTLDAPSGAYAGDAAAAGKVAAALEAIGISVRVNALPKAQLFDKLTRRDSSFYMMSWNCLTGDMQEIFLFLLHSPDSAHGRGSENAGGYSNPTVDQLFEEAGETMVPEARLPKLEKAVRLAMLDVPWVPLYVQDQIYGIRDPWDWTPRPDKKIRITELRRR